jgi:serine/threonine protein kinase
VSNADDANPFSHLPGPKCQTAHYDGRDNREVEREAKVLAALSHPNIAAIYGLEQVDRSPYLAMELAEGHDLSEIIAGPSPSARGRRAGRAAIHRAGAGRG